MRRGRVFAAVSSALTVAVALLGAGGVFQLPDPATMTLTADQSDVDRNANRASRSTRPETVPPANPSKSASPSSTPKPAVTPPPASPSPKAGEWPLPEDSGEGKRVVYDLGDNYVWLVDDDDSVERGYRVSGTAFGQVKVGSYEVYKKRLHTTSYLGEATMNYMVSFTKTVKGNGIGFHDIPEDIDTGEPVQTIAQLGQSLSDGCIRQARPDAKALWNFTEVGSKVVIVP